MYYPESPNKKMAAENGNGFYGTHTGVLFYDKDGKWKVAHNIGDGVSEKNKGAGKIWVEDFKQMQSKTSHHRPTAIITPNKHGSLSKARKAIRNIFGFTDGKSPEDYLKKEWVYGLSVPMSVGIDVTTHKKIQKKRFD